MINRKYKGDLIACAVVALLAATGGSAANAASFYCVGQVSNVFSSSSGELLFKASWRGNYVAVCNLLANWNGIEPALCKNWYATLLTAQITGTVVSIYYQNTASGSCMELPTYGSAPAPGYVMLGDTWE